MQRLSPAIALFSFFVLTLSFFKRNDFPDELAIAPELMQEPVQSLMQRPAFDASYNNEDYKILPKYDYELYGLVVSFRLHDADGSTMLHDLSKDHLNVADFCLVWGKTADPKLLQHMSFSNGQFTCNYSSKSHQVWQAFDHHQLSNNHLLALNEAVRTQIDQVKIGDQIRIKGWLSHYVNPLGYERGTSIIRTDQGNGACETIFVNEIELIQPMSSVWRRLLWLSACALLLSLWMIYQTPIRAEDFEKDNTR